MTIHIKKYLHYSLNSQRFSHTFLSNSSATVPSILFILNPTKRYIRRHVTWIPVFSTLLLQTFWPCLQLQMKETSPMPPGYTVGYYSTQRISHYSEPYYVLTTSLRVYPNFSSFCYFHTSCKCDIGEWGIVWPIVLSICGPLCFHFN
jgi:hypothetical protein